MISFQLALETWQFTNWTSLRIPSVQKTWVVPVADCPLAHSQVLLTHWAVTAAGSPVIGGIHRRCWAAEISLYSVNGANLIAFCCCCCRLLRSVVASCAVSIVQSSFQESIVQTCSCFETDFLHVTSIHVWTQNGGISGASFCSVLPLARLDSVFRVILLLSWRSVSAYCNELSCVLKYSLLTVLFISIWMLSTGECYVFVNCL
jgi:hypothetical protein